MQSLTLPAIELRGPWHEHGWLFYEFNRAFCRIMNDSAFVQDQPNDPDRKAQILEDLVATVHADDITRVLKSDPVIQKWMSLNNIAGRDETLIRNMVATTRLTEWKTKGRSSVD